MAEDDLTIKTMKKSTIIILLLLTTQMTWAGGGWPIPKGKGYFKLSEYFIRSNGYFAPSGDVIDIATAGIYITSLYGEYGITDRFGVIAYVPFFSRATLNEQVDRNGNVLAQGDAVNSFGDTDISFKYGLITNKPIVVSATLTFGLPFGNDQGGETGVLQTGDGEFNTMIALEASRGINGGKGWINTLVGYNNRSNNFSDEFRWGLEIGHKFGKKWSGGIKFYSVNSLNNGSDFETPSNGIFSNNIEYLSFTPEVNYFIKENLGVSASIGGALSAKRVLASPGYSLGVFMTL